MDELQIKTLTRIIDFALRNDQIKNWEIVTRLSEDSYVLQFRIDGTILIIVYLDENSRVVQQSSIALRLTMIGDVKTIAKATDRSGLYPYLQEIILTIKKNEEKQKFDELLMSCIDVVERSGGVL